MLTLNTDRNVVPARVPISTADPVRVVVPNTASTTRITVVEVPRRVDRTVRDMKWMTAVITVAVARPTAVRVPNSAIATITAVVVRRRVDPIIVDRGGPAMISARRAASTSNIDMKNSRIIAARDMMTSASRIGMVTIAATGVDLRRHTLAVTTGDLARTNLRIAARARIIVDPAATLIARARLKAG